tara:strand:+ start:344 stop:1048 length:705 start_codon:yes stop_codon:yes gene_type:complete
MIKEAIVLAGGFGTRLQSVVKELPKSMAPINHKPFLEYLLDFLIAKGIENIIFSVGYKSSDIKNHFKGQYQNLKISYAEEKEALGTGGAIAYAMSFAKSEQVLVLNGDTLFLADPQEQLKFHLQLKADVSLALKPMENFDRYGRVELDNDQRIVKFIEKKYCDKGLINGGSYIFNKSIFSKFDLPNRFSIEQDFFEKYFGDLHLFGFISSAYFLDIGIPSDYDKAQDEFKSITY